jgi:hypothetical protein
MRFIKVSVTVIEVSVIGVDVAVVDVLDSVMTFFEVR